MRILLVKTSSLGDVIHNLPVVSDVSRAFPGALIDWCVEGSFAEIPRLHPAVQLVIPVGLRRWRKSLFRVTTWGEIDGFRQTLRAQDYDVVLDTQGLLKSALVTCVARGRRCGYDRASIREPLASRVYQQTFSVSKALHAVQRNRLLAAAALGYTINASDSTAIDYGIAPHAIDVSWLPARDYAVLLTATSRDDKCWPDARWRSVINDLLDREIVPVLPTGAARERRRAERIAAQTGAILAPHLDLTTLASVLAGARVTIGVDTGLTHLSAAANTPTIALFVASDPGLTGVIGRAFVRNLGARGHAPDTADVIAALGDALQ